MIWHASHNTLISSVSTQRLSHSIKLVLKSLRRVVKCELEGSVDVLLSVASASTKRGSPEKVNAVIEVLSHANPPTLRYKIVLPGLYTYCIVVDIRAIFRYGKVAFSSIDSKPKKSEPFQRVNSKGVAFIKWDRQRKPVKPGNIAKRQP